MVGSGSARASALARILKGMSSHEQVALDAESRELARLMGERLEQGFALSSFASELAGKAQRDEV